MGKKNRKKNKKVSGGGAGAGAGAGGNNNNNNNNNNSTIPTVATMELTTEEIAKVDELAGLKDYTKSHYFVIGTRLLGSGCAGADRAIDSFKRGAENNSCVCCMYFHSLEQQRRNNIHLTVPLAIESAIRGHLPSTILLISCYRETKPAPSIALMSFWMKSMTEITDFEDEKQEVQTTDHSVTKVQERIHHFERSYGTIEEKRKERKKACLDTCFSCGKKDTKERTFHKCGRCKQYSYCGKECQTRHWKELEHMSECRQFMILKEYFKPRYVREIREAIIAGDDPKTIVRLQTLRTQLGLNRPKEDYEELLLSLSDDDTNDISKSPNRYEYLVARKDGTVHIGSTPNII